MSIVYLFKMTLILSKHHECYIFYRYIYNIYIKWIKEWNLKNRITLSILRHSRPVSCSCSVEYVQFIKYVDGNREKECSPWVQPFWINFNFSAASRQLGTRHMSAYWINSLHCNPAPVLHSALAADGRVLLLHPIAVLFWRHYCLDTPLSRHCLANMCTQRWHQ